MLNINFKEIRQYKVFRIFALMILSGAFCLLSADSASAQSGVLAITKTTSNVSVTAGSDITYIITLTNIGNAEIFFAQLTDFIPADTTFVRFLQNNDKFNCTVTSPGAGAGAVLSCETISSLFPGASAQFTLVVKVNPTAAGTIIVNTAEVSYADVVTLFIRKAAATAFTTVLIPTAAAVTVSGRVMTQAGRGINGVRLSLTDSQGNVRTATTTSFGYYRFDNVMAGETVILTARAKRFTFNQSSIVRTTNDSISNADFVSEQ